MKPTIGITMGDPAGIGPEIVVKALTHPALYERCIPIVLGDAAAIQDAIRFTRANLRVHPIESPDVDEGGPATIALLDSGLLQPGSWEYGKVSVLGGRAAFSYVSRGIELALGERLDAVVTGPINKESLNLAGYHYSGHTEIFAKMTNTSNFAMMLSNGGLRVIHVTTHVSLRRACDLITTDRVLDVIRLAHQAMLDIDISQPRIAVAGLNPHSSENGLFGDEEARAIIPAIESAREEGIRVDGPVPPDTVFVKAAARQYDVVVAMYHDQGHIPLKLSGFRMDPASGSFTAVSGINYTVGLPIIRTSVDHGTAFDRAGLGEANEESMLEAIDLAIRLARKRIGEKR